MESTDRSWAAAALRRADGRIPIEELIDGFGQFDSGTALVAYAESLMAGQLLCERVGQNLGPFLQMLGSGHSVDQALSTVNIQPESFYAEWRRRIGMRDQALREGLNLNRRIRPNPEAHSVRIAVRDPATGAVGSVSISADAIRSVLRK